VQPSHAGDAMACAQSIAVGRRAERANECCAYADASTR